jgi:hypothetical protein
MYCTLTFFLEYVGELCIIALRRRKDPNTATTPPPLGSERGEGDYDTSITK